MRTLVLALAFALLLPATAQARRTATFHYPLSRVWTATVRLMRVDFESPITEKDKEEGYFFFDYPHLGKHHPGSVEIIESRRPDGRHSVRVVIRIPAMPKYIEQMMLDRLERKLFKDYGSPARPPRATSVDRKKAGRDGDQPAQEPDKAGAKPARPETEKKR